MQEKRMGADLPLVAATWMALQPLVGEEKCSGCECLQGALVELRLTLDELPEAPERARLLADIGAAMQVGAPHACLGCEPCNPGNILADFSRQQQAQASAAQPCCDAG
jgi:hypothetical protein